MSMLRIFKLTRSRNRPLIVKLTPSGVLHEQDSERHTVLSFLDSMLATCSSTLAHRVEPGPVGNRTVLRRGFQFPSWLPVSELVAAG
ncbi:uncharacterized protein BDZ99DRAFT_94023 [Mytilinidion resinicola]|uniref:Uncharacterized protein n=1 Tax=Mytilinidion resinicola TaxID=574789 RepID=A0A6A6YC15_9PEZI|nr:uncharacterized protein BDZ99DRAFT_94023 [Mytilinidion resinicola]KAF2806361.1 hypothetical protein BDZ99DRAFT_94023 [Mytilinidion resinicola]